MTSAVRSAATIGGPDRMAVRYVAPSRASDFSADRQEDDVREARLLGEVATGIATGPRVAAEPPLREHTRDR